MKIDQLIFEAADTLRKIPYFGSTPIFEQDKGDLVNELERAVAQTSRAIVVGWNGFSPVMQGGNETLLGDTTVVVEIYETPATNRTYEGVPTLLSLAQHVADALQCAKTADMTAPLYLKRISPVTLVNASTINCTVEFTAKAYI